MPSKSPSQRRLMRACASDKGRKSMDNCPPKKVAKKYAKADQKKSSGKSR